MKFLSLDWFKSERQKEIEELVIKEQQLKVELLEKEKEQQEKSQRETSSKPYKNVKLVGDVLTVVLHDGNIISKPNATTEDFNKVRTCLNEKEVFKIVVPQEHIQEERKKDEEIKKVEKILESIEVLKNSPDFQVVDNSVYMVNFDGVIIQRSIPELLVREFASLLSNQSDTEDSKYQALKKFWLKCCSNPNAQSAEDLYIFLNHHQFKIDKHGNFYAYRNVVSKGNPNKALVEFVSNTYNKVKAVWKKKPADYFVWSEDDGTLTFNKSNKGDGIANFRGNLEELYKNLSSLEENDYTDFHTRTFTYKVGTTISMPRNEGNDDNTVSCSKGFHAASKAYDYSGFGDTSILVIINPMDVLAVPQNEVGKLRTCRWFFASILSKDERHILDDEDFDVSDLGDKFEEECQINLEDYIKKSFAEEVKRHTFQLPQITGREINSIVLSLDKMRESISNRVNNI